MFSGIGGFELGIRQSEIKSEDSTNSKGGTSQLPRRSFCVGFSEVDKYAIQIYQQQFKGHKAYGDCTRIDYSTVPDFEMLVGGFPCQAFSIAGKRRGFEDTRGTLFFEVARCLKEKQPRLCVLENVKGLLSHDQGATFTTIISTLDELGYDCQWQVLNSKNFGVPQNRERVFIIGHLRGGSRPEVFPIGQSSAKAIIKIMNEGGNHAGGGVFDYDGVCPTLTSGGTGGATNNCAKIIVAGTLESGGGAMTKILKNSRIRRLTPTECERLQGFPDGWTEGISDTQRYKCLGNAVTVNVIEAIITELFKEK